MADRAPGVSVRRKPGSGSKGPVKAQAAKKLGIRAGAGEVLTQADIAEALRSKVEAAGLDPIAKLIELIEGGKVGENMQIRALEILTSYLYPKQKAVDEELEKLKRQTAEAARYVILGEREEASAAEWEARNRHWLERLAVPAPVVVDEKVPEGVVPS